jgi:hypothetical protein
MLAVIAIGFALPWVVVLGALAAERWLEAPQRSVVWAQREPEGRNRT